MVGHETIGMYSVPKSLNAFFHELKVFVSVRIVIKNALLRVPTLCDVLEHSGYVYAISPRHVQTLSFHGLFNNTVFLTGEILLPICGSGGVYLVFVAVNVDIFIVNYGK